MDTKYCNKCGTDKALDAFTRDRAKPDGLYLVCKLCRRKYRQANSEKISEYHRKYRQANSEKLSENGRNYHEANSEKINENKRKYNQANSEKISEYQRRAVENLRDSYIAACLRVPVKDVPPALLEVKRIQLQIKRYLKNGH